MDDETIPESPPPASFKGRLQLQDFMFQPKSPSNMASSTDSPLRRSTRLLTPSIPASPSSASASASPSRPRSTPGTKRKAITLLPSNEEDDNTLTPLSSTPSPSPKKRPRSRPPSTYAAPSVYAHLPHLPDAMAPNLLVLLVGLNPGIQTARQQHAYAHPSNLFWKLLFSSGLTPDRLVPPAEDRGLPKTYGLGLTNIVSRPSRNGAELSKAEMDAGVALLEEKARRWRPEVTCVVGKSIWESIWRVRHGRGIRKEEFRYGWQDEGENMGKVGEAGQRDEEREEGVDYGEGNGSWEGSRVFVACSTSGLAATLRPPEKEAIWRELGVWVEKRREERKAASTA
ncbi:DNA glycosylase [Coniochaeta ligniaria NRRL 30616]|uniref:DNA glycosylase n=1 Tax=Coniochaeta ligniaria NRRL 30616 TaxID=1408157 RepID=A0A1J7IE43_9PEZI|nr:DNA glycosylase [Coniochaeta ligniaria NRRL 30616]